MPHICTYVAGLHRRSSNFANINGGIKRITIELLRRERQMIAAANGKPANAPVAVAIHIAAAVTVAVVAVVAAVAVSGGNLNSAIKRAKISHFASYQFHMKCLSPTQSANARISTLHTHTHIASMEESKTHGIVLFFVLFCFCCMIVAATDLFVVVALLAIGLLCVFVALN